jgi:hypothetical protein
MAARFNKQQPEPNSHAARAKFFSKAIWIIDEVHMQTGPWTFVSVMLLVQLASRFQELFEALGRILTSSWPGPWGLQVSNHRRQGLSDESTAPALA